MPRIRPSGIPVFLTDPSDDASPRGERKPRNKKLVTPRKRRVDRSIDGLEMNTVNNTEIDPGSVNQQRPRLAEEVPDTQALAAEAVQRQVLPQPNQFGAVRDRLFHAMLVRVAISYNRHVPVFGKRFIEFSSLVTAIVLLSVMIYVHHFFDETESNCLAPFVDQWPRNGVLRVEVVRNLKKFNTYQDRLLEKSYGKQNSESNTTVYDLKRVLMKGPSALPKELRSRPRHHFRTIGNNSLYNGFRKKNDYWSSFLTSEDSLLNLFIRSDNGLKKKLFLEELDDDEFDFESEDLFDDSDASFEYVVEYSLYYGLLKLPHSYRLEHNISFLLVRLDPEVDSCFGDWVSRALMKNFIGYLRDMITGEHYRFVTMGNPRASYFTALIVMLIFTFAISMLLRFSHHQIFLFIVDLLQMFELNQALVFPAAPLLTVILALVGMEAIMSEVFNDTSTAFYVILLIWIADQYDAICCHSPISKRHWLRFFYLYHYAFYAYQYRYNGQYGSLALLTSTLFILHSMIFFFHHYEMPLIIYHDRLQRIISDMQHNPQPGGGTGTSPGTQTAPNISANSTSVVPSTINLAVEVSTDRSLYDGEASSSGVETTAGGAWSSETEEVSSALSKQQTAVELDEGSNLVAEIGNLNLSDPLLMAGERTAHEIVDSAIDCVFNSTVTRREADTPPS
uniref:Membralin n=1 Tax=Wuchereria bancrofti TaxID=6293 RepID=A0A1I8EMF3_WUCBA